MSVYLARLKRLENEKKSQYVSRNEPSKPSKAPFEPFEGILPAHIDDAKIMAQPSDIAAERNELDLLIGIVARYYGFTDHELAEIREMAYADPDNALVCYRSLSQKIKGLMNVNSEGEFYGYKTLR